MQNADTDYLTVPTGDRMKVNEDGSGDYSKENTMIMSMAENSIKKSYISEDIIRVGEMEVGFEADGYKSSVHNRVKFSDPKFKDWTVEERTREYIKDKKSQCKSNNIPWKLEAYHIHAMEEAFPTCMFFPELGPLVYTEVNQDSTANIDRLDPDPTVGYVEGNVRRISWKANSIKSNYRGELILAVGKGMQRAGL